MPYDLIVCMCSRGVVHSRTVEAVDRNLEYMAQHTSFTWKREWSHDKKIPDAQNNVIDKALEHDPKWLWMVEEDMMPQDDMLNRLRVLCKSGIITPNYNLRGGQKSCWLDTQGRLVLGGTGCLFMTRALVDKLPRPIFRVDIEYGYDHIGGFTKPYKNLNYDPLEVYGRHDIHLFYTLKQLGIQPDYLDVLCPHLMVKAWGKQNCNQGSHEVVAIE